MYFNLHQWGIQNRKSIDSGYSHIETGCKFSIMRGDLYDNVCNYTLLSRDYRGNTSNNSTNITNYSTSITNYSTSITNNTTNTIASSDSSSDTCSKNSSASGSSNSHCTMFSYNSIGSITRVSSNNSSRVSLLDRLLSTSGGDSVGTVLDDLDINNSFTDSPGNLPRSVNRHLVTMSHRNTTADRSRGGDRTNTSVGYSNTTSKPSISISITLSISYQATSIASSESTSTKKSTCANHSTGSSNKTASTITTNTSNGTGSY